MRPVSSLTPLSARLAPLAALNAGWKANLLALCLGALTVFGYAPFGLFWLPWLTLAGLCWLWQQAASPRASFQRGWFFGLGLYGLGIYWIYISLHTFGGMPWWFAGFATGCLCAFMALFPALCGALAHRLGAVLWTAPWLWALSDWVRSWIFTGFPWLTLGYSQAPDSPLAGYLPVFGVYLVSALVMLLAAGLVASVRQPRRVTVVSALLALLVIGSGLTQVRWTQPAETPFSVALLQGNVSQSLKWSPTQAEHTLAHYLQLVRASQAQLIVLPETALPVLREQIDPRYMDALAQHARAQGGDVLLGVVDYRQSSYLNSAVSVGRSPQQDYAKRHLVPFGEFIPLKGLFGWIYRDWLQMPLSDLARGQSTQPLQIAGQQVGVNICYEDVFGEEIAQQLPAAEILVNMSNDAWYGQSFAAEQHMQFSQVRALETGRMVLRSTNTGATAIIDVHGTVLQHAPHDTVAILQGQARSYRGATPYVWWKNGAFLALSTLALAAVLWRRYGHTRSAN